MLAAGTVAVLVYLQTMDPPFVLYALSRAIPWTASTNVGCMLPDALRLFSVIIEWAK